MFRYNVTNLFNDYGKICSWKKKIFSKKKKEQMNAAWGRDHFTILEIPYKVISM